MDDEVQREARALGDPTRHRLFRYIVDAAEPVGAQSQRCSPTPGCAERDPFGD